MKQKKYFILAAAAILMAACSENDIAEKQSPQAQQAVEQAVEFGAYVNRGITRAGEPGELTTSGTPVSLQAVGFGVFGYYTDGELYASNTKPNFFYNQKVSTSAWTYSPVKYWPNEFGNDASSDQVDRLSFFAYAPYVDVDPLTGIVTTKNTENITGMTRNNATGDPFVKYTATLDPTNTVDLCYAVAAEDITSSNSTSFPNKIAKGEPLVNMTKPGIDGKIKLDFKHALAKLNVQVDYDVDEVSHGTKALDPFTRIWVRSVTFEGITIKGALNLHNHEWYQIDASGDNKISSGAATVYDGLKDGKEPVGSAANETPASLNPAIIQSKPYDGTALATSLKTTDATVIGVGTGPQNLFKSTSLTQPIFVIPTGEKMKVTIVYDVETYDSNLAYYLSDGVTRGSTIQNSITKTVDAFGELQSGYAYTLKLHLGMRSVEFTATVSEWDTTTPESNTDLPSNLPTYAAGASSAVPLGEAATIGAAETSYHFAVSGLKAGETVNLTGSGVTVPASVTASAAGVADITATIAANTTTSKIPCTVTVAGATSTKGGIVTINQAPHALELNIVSCVGTTLTLSKSDELTTPANFSSTTITVTKLSDASTITATPTDTGATLASAPDSGEKYEVKVVSGNVTETKTFVAP